MASVNNVVLNIQHGGSGSRRLVTVNYPLELIMKRITLLASLLLATNALGANPPPATAVWSDTTTTGAAMGYCLAKHPYQTIYSGRFTPDGYQIVASPGIVGAVRRNFVYDRSTDASDEGNANSTCKQACSEFGKMYSPYVGAPLRQKVGPGGTTTINSGIGDMASLAVKDRDFYLSADVVAGVWSRGNTWHESDVAQSDYCCCQAIAPRGIKPSSNVLQQYAPKQLKQ